MEQPLDAGRTPGLSLQQGREDYRQGRWTRAEICFESVTGSAEAGHADLAAAWHHLANLQFFRGRTGPALDYFRRALDYYRAGGDLAGEATALFDMSRVYQSAADYRSAYELLERVIELDRQLGSPDLKSHKIVLGAIRRKLREQGYSPGSTKG